MLRDPIVNEGIARPRVESHQSFIPNPRDIGDAPNIEDGHWFVGLAEGPVVKRRERCPLPAGRNISDPKVCDDIDPYGLR